MCQHGTCVNTVGSFTCLCSTGYVYDDASHQCIDDNECLTAVCAANARCVNTPGSYRCECPPGYRPGDPDPARRSAGCLDVDECTERRNVCQRGTCRNVAGGFQCVCQEGSFVVCNVVVVHGLGVIGCPCLQDSLSQRPRILAWTWTSAP